MTLLGKINRHGCLPWLSVLRPQALNIQFVGYEGGNIIAAVAGAGGLASLWAGVQGSADTEAHSWLTSVFQYYPDVAVTLGVALVIVWIVVLRGLLGQFVPGQSQGWVDHVAAVAGLGLVGVALAYGTTWLTASAVFFVVGSAFLRQATEHPVLLKIGGLSLSLGGFSLSMSGAQQGLTLLGVVTALTGLSVVFAGLLTYKGGYFVCLDQSEDKQQGWLQKILSRWIDQPVLWFVSRVITPSLFWINDDTKRERPFLTSMWARLPFRALAGTVAMATATPEGAVFAVACAFWALGDAAIGSLDVASIDA